MSRRLTFKTSLADRDAGFSGTVRSALVSEMSSPRLLSTEGFQAALESLELARGRDEVRRAEGSHYGRSRRGGSVMSMTVSTFVPDEVAEWLQWYPRELGVVRSDVIRNAVAGVPLNTPLAHYSHRRAMQILGAPEPPALGKKLGEYDRLGEMLDYYLRRDRCRFTLMHYAERDGVLLNPAAPLSVLREGVGRPGVSPDTRARVLESDVYRSYEAQSSEVVPVYVHGAEFREAYSALVYG